MDLQNSIRRHFDNVAPKFITWEFYEPYTKLEPPFGQLGLPVFLRTYSRHIASEKRREKWVETVLRNVEFSVGLDNKTPFAQLQEEAQDLFDFMFNLRTFPSGRSLWTAGSLQTKTDPSSSWNCTFRTIDGLSAYGEIFYWLLIGAGCGFSVEKEYTDNLPSFFNHNKTIQHINQKQWLAGHDDTELYVEGRYIKLNKLHLFLSDSDYYNILDISPNTTSIVITVGDSKEGWVNALRTYLTLLTLEQPLKITFDYKYVRPPGIPLKTFGGVATGCKNFVRMIDQINFITQGVEGKLNTNQSMDLVGIVALCVVSGNIRRSALIALGEPTDDLFKNAKYDLWVDEQKAPYRAFRVMSNNSIVVDNKPTKEELYEVFEKIKSNGEPGLYIRENARKHDPEVIGTNPCVETSLRNRQSCNLTTNNVTAFIKYNDKNEPYLDEVGWRKSLFLSTRIGSRVTTLPQWHPEWDKVQKSQRLLGVSMTGLMDAADKLNWSEEEMEDFLTRSRLYVREVADKYHEQLGIERGVRISCVKPEGSISQLPTVSSGVHRGYAPNYIRRVRFSSVDPLAKALLTIFGEENVHPENGQGDNLYTEGVDTWVFSFPIETAAKIRAIDESAISQLERYRLAQSCYTADGHNTSITVTVAPDEWNDVVEWVYDNWDYVIGVSFLPKYDPEVETYPQMPYEPCSVEVCNQLKELTPTFTENELIGLIAKYEDKYEEYEIIDEACSTGACPIR